LVNDILDVSRLDSDTMKFDMKRVSPNEFLDEIAEDLKPVVEKKNLEFQKDIPSDLPPILCDSHRFMQVIRNLIINSVKFTDKGFIRLSATIEDSWLHICVEDTGIGIRRDELPSIFHKFYQADSGERRQHEGTGLGLFICKEIVKKHHGDITVRSALGKGSMFCVKLPVLVK
ncbi:MAG: HAMP domain-containing histidine kinase, partial [Thermoplasmatales archaeon]|nr:HAMP domain-containing histidine kinase [Thermoplasmatales archaeon]